MKCNVVVVNFVDNTGEVSTQKDYSYFTDLELERGDVVVVQARDFVGLARVTQVLGLTAMQRVKATRWVVCKVDFTAVVENERKMSLANEIRAMLREAKESFEERRIYEILAKDDPKIAALLEEYNKLMVTE
jgi:hypothetical protein